MASRRQPPTPQVQERICSFIRAGGFAHVAAEAAGVSRDVFEDWLEQGRPQPGRRRPAKRYREFFQAVRQAQAEARLAAELKLLEKNPLQWLKCGPGRETPGAPGWTTPVKPLFAGDGDAVNVLLLPEFQAVLVSMLDALAPFPEARAALAPFVADPDADPDQD
jgi:hypothetical protein